MLAAVATIIDGVAPERVRATVSIAAFAIAATGAVAVGRSGRQAEISSGNMRIAFLATVAAGILLVAVPIMAQAFGRSDPSAHPTTRTRVRRD
jgi:hypothetical protein